MTGKLCPNCGAPRTKSATGYCPNCRTPIASSTAPPNPIQADVPPVVVPPTRAPQTPSFAGTENPYLPPQMKEQEDLYAYDGDARVDQGFVWALLSFHGRIPRRTYWGLSLAATAIYYGLGLLLVIVSEAVDLVEFEFLFLPVAAFFFWAMLAVQAKRWHDRNKSGWWFLIGFIPLIGPLIALVELGCLRGSNGPNQYGPDPT